MAFNFSSMSSPAPSTPDRNQKKGASNFASAFGLTPDHPSTTPAGPPPPSSAPSFTPAGDPSPSYLNSSIGAMGGRPPPKFNLGRSSKSSSRRSNAPLARSLGGSTARQPSSLRQEYHVDYDEEEDEDADADGDDDPDAMGEDDTMQLPASRPGTFGINLDDSFDEDEEDEEDELDAEAEEDYEQDDAPADEDDYEDDEEDRHAGEAMERDDDDFDVTQDILDDIARQKPSANPFSFSNYNTDIPLDQDDDMMLADPIVDDLVDEEADSALKASHMRSTTKRPQDCKYSTLAKDLYRQYELAQLTEGDEVILQTEEIVARLYDEGVGAEDDPDKLDATIAKACVDMINSVWDPYTETLPAAFEEHAAKVGPSADAPDFEKAKYLAALVLRIHHTPPVKAEFGVPKYLALPGVLFNWQEDEHNYDREQVDAIMRHRPAPAAHGLFWQGVFNSLVRGNIHDATQLLKRANWESVKKSARGDSLYNGQALDNIRRVTDSLCQLMDTCPAVSDGNWDTRSSDWIMFRIRARSAKDSLTSFAEGKNSTPDWSDLNRFNESKFADSMDSRRSLSGLARKAESRIPWEIYENLQSLYAILMGDAAAILAASQDWCEATLGLFGWWDDGQKQEVPKALPQPGMPPQRHMADEESLERLSLALHTAMRSDFHFDSTDPVEVGIASVFEDNVDAVLGFLRIWSLPVASTVAEIASLGCWLPPPEPHDLIGMESFDMEDLEVLGLAQGSNSNEKDSVKDVTLIHYARGLSDRKTISGNTSTGQTSREGWELAVQVVGRMDSVERSEEMVRDLLQSVLDNLAEDSHATVDKIWKLLNDLGMIAFAEETAEAFGDILARDTHRFGETMWYYAMSHRPGKIRDVLNALMSISLVESTVYPPTAELDDFLKRLLQERTAALEQFAKQDLEAAELLGKMLSGYATLRRFYELREGAGKDGQKSPVRRQQAASALIAVIASGDDNIRGGLYDDSRDAVVSEDFLLALLGEATVFVNQSPPAISLEQIDTLLKTIEDIQTVGSRVYDAADEFFKLVLASGQGLKGSSPADLLKSTSGNLGGSFMMTGSSMMASQLHQSVARSGLIKGPVKRAWDWRTSTLAGSSSADVLKRIRLGLTRDLASMWLEQADSVIL